jgi:copper chaperone
MKVEYLRPSGRPPKKDCPMSQQITVFTVPDMSCGHCEKTLRAAFAEALPGAELQIDLPAHRLAVAADAGTARRVIESAGYSPALAE